MSEKKFYLTRYSFNEDRGVFVVDGGRKSLEDDFGFIRYKSISGINSRGKQKGVYVETYAEGEGSRVYFTSSAKREQITSTLSLCVFGSSPENTTEKSVYERISIAENAWHSFCDWIENHLILWYDEYRQRKALFYLSEAIEPKSDIIKNTPYLACDINLSNVFGKTFALDDNTIEDWLKAGGKG